MSQPFDVQAQYLVPDPKKILFTRDGTPLKVIGEFRRRTKEDMLGDPGSYILVETVEPNKPPRRFAISKYRLGQDIQDSGGHKPPIRILHGRPAPDEIQPIVLPDFNFTDGPTVNGEKDSLIIEFETSVQTYAMIYYGLSSNVSYPYPSYLNPHYGPNVPPNLGPNIEPYPYLYNGGGYDKVFPWKLLDVKHRIDIPGLVSGKIYNVIVCIFDRNNKGPVCSENFIVQIPTA